MDKLGELMFGTQKAIVAFCLMVLLALCLLVRFVVTLDEHSQLAYLQLQVQAQAGDLRNRVEHEINTALNLTMGSLVYVASHPDITQAEFARFAEDIMRRAPYIQNLGLARDNVITHIYPMQGNEKALGLRYLDNAEQRAAVLRAINTRNTVIAGPVDLVQGGQGFISRIPIFLDEGEKRYWGVASIVVKTEPFYAKVGLIDGDLPLNVAVRGKDATGATGEIFFGDAKLFADPASVVLSIPLPEGSWVLAAQPKQGRSTDKGRIYALYTLGLGVSVFITILLYSLLMKNLALKAEQRKVLLASEHKNRFFSNMTHELRTPLTAVYGSVRLLNSGKLPADSSAWKDLCDNAERNCQRLMWLINDILDLKKLESGKFQYHLSEESVLNIVSDAIQEMQPYAEQFQIPLQLHPRLTPSATVMADRKRIHQVMLNLLSNAIKFSPAHTAVEIIVEPNGTDIRIKIVDYGSGIEADKIAGIFNEFEQAEAVPQSARKLPAGTGLGLSISKQLVQDHGGHIGCYNQPQSGAVFFFTLPAANTGDQTEAHNPTACDSKTTPPAAYAKTLP